MKAYTAKLLLATAALTALTGCYVVPLSVAQRDHVPRVTKFMAVGYGSVSSYERYTEPQKKLMAMRASKLDAYRALAEQVYGVRVTGNSTVSAMMAQNDSFRVSIDAYLRGARVTNVVQAVDGTYETSVEMDYDENIVQSFIMQVPSRSAPAYTASRGAVGPGSAYGVNYYYAD